MPKSNKQTLNKIEPEVIFIGAGPVGLFTAIQAKLHNPALKILMIDRNQQYTRNHILKIDPTSYTGCHPNLEFRSILGGLSGQVPTQKIESDLRAFADKLSIHFQMGKKIEPGEINQLRSVYPTVRTIVGAGGAHDPVRQGIFNDEKELKNNFQYIIKVSYQVKNSTRRLRVGESIEALANVPRLVSEFVGKEIDGITPVSQFVFVNKATYDEVRALWSHNREKNKRNAPNSNNKRYVTFADLQAGSNEMTALTNTILPWKALRHALLGDEIVVGSDNLSAVSLNTYRSKKCVKSVGDLRYILVGDAAMGVPYYRALNAGLRGAIPASRVIADSMAYQPGNVEHDQVHKTLNLQMRKISLEEIRNANQKASAVSWATAGAGFLRFALKGNEFVNPNVQTMRAARVSPLPWYKRHSSWVTAGLIFAVLLPVLALSGAIAAIPVIGVVLTTMLGTWGAAALAGGIVTAVTMAIGHGISSIIKHHRISHSNSERLEHLEEANMAAVEPVQVSATCPRPVISKPVQIWRLPATQPLYSHSLFAKHGLEQKTKTSLSLDESTSPSP